MTNKSIVVAGHICVDMIPDMSACKGPLDKVIVPGKLVNVGAPLMSTGGVVANTGLALHKLGLPVKLLGKVGDDSFGQIICQIVGANSPQLSRDMIISRGESTSYSVVISVPGCDRAFLHYPGTNNTFCADDINYESLEGVSLFHFGYPPLMRKMFLNNGAELAQMFGKVKAMGITTSMDMTLPDPDSESGRVDWACIRA
ncbi:MAG TPA: carbohydrate kinase family protein, partial [Phycisphaerae bacterium]|nr:carbohydrate kinase family protein [Phycisphaerae bacterium]